MNKFIPMLSESDIPADLAAYLRPRLERLGYLGEFFRYTAHQPKALMSFLSFTEDLKSALPNNLTEVVALSVAQLMENSYERVQHERLSLKLGFGERWVRGVLSLGTDGNENLSGQEAKVQKLVIAVVTRKGHHCASELETVAETIGSAMAIAVLMLIGRYLTHALIVNTLALTPPVPSPIGNK
jgi:alkylhydroperoxidase family enzyme